MHPETVQSNVGSQRHFLGAALESGLGVRVVRSRHDGRRHLRIDAEARDKHLVHRLFPVKSNLGEKAEHLLLGGIGHHVGQLEHLAAIVAQIEFILCNIAVETGRVQASVGKIFNKREGLDALENLG